MPATLMMLEAKLKRDALGQMTEYLAKSLPETLTFDGCQSLTPYLNEDGQTLVIVELWDSKAHYEKYLAASGVLLEGERPRLGSGEDTGELAEFEEMLEGEPSFRFFEPIDA